mmetsp:Transcript_43816/g.51306  ORF Transcript_43816/g.51306 Transcript_43816/m.51306 type:complete len:89 (+) Transcript_43816:386-652(+)
MHKFPALVWPSSSGMELNAPPTKSLNSTAVNANASSQTSRQANPDKISIVVKNVRQSLLRVPMRCDGRSEPHVEPMRHIAGKTIHMAR